MSKPPLNTSDFDCMKKKCTDYKKKKNVFHRRKTDMQG